ncbi:MAG TPA: hypothetical protein VM145_08005 [Sphingomicrobium sp.]|nr:hypothetical protein [Sphingomicrobium sp.]
MSAPSFRSLTMAATCAAAALGCYMVSLRVASERASLEDVETRIVLAQRDLRVLQTEIGTRGRLSQLERWNAGAFALSAPAADQFLRGGFELARLTQPEHQVDFQAPVVLASAPVQERQKPPIGQADTDDSGAPTSSATQTLLHQASLKTETREVPAKPAAALATGTKSIDRPVTAAKPAQSKSMDKPGLAAAKSTAKAPVANAAEAKPKPGPKKSVDKPAIATAKPVTKPVRLAKADPLAPLPDRHSGRSKDASAAR